MSKEADKDDGFQNAKAAEHLDDIAKNKTSSESVNEKVKKQKDFLKKQLWLFTFISVLTSAAIFAILYYQNPY